MDGFLFSLLLLQDVETDNNKYSKHKVKLQLQSSKPASVDVKERGKLST